MNPINTLMNQNSTQISQLTPHSPPKKHKKTPKIKEEKNTQTKLQWYSEGPSDTHCARTNAL